VFTPRFFTKDDDCDDVDGGFWISRAVSAFEPTTGFLSPIAPRTTERFFTALVAEVLRFFAGTWGNLYRSLQREIKVT